MGDNTRSYNLNTPGIYLVTYVVNDAERVTKRVVVH
jgi:hypothetical protein